MGKLLLFHNYIPWSTLCKSLIKELFSGVGAVAFCTKYVRTDKSKSLHSSNFVEEKTDTRKILRMAGNNNLSTDSTKLFCCRSQIHIVIIYGNKKYILNKTQNISFIKYLKKIYVSVFVLERSSDKQF